MEVGSNFMFAFFFSIIYQIFHIFTDLKCDLYHTPKYTLTFDVYSSSIPHEIHFSPDCLCLPVGPHLIAVLFAAYSFFFFFFPQRYVTFTLYCLVAPSNPCPLLSWSHFTQFYPGLIWSMFAQVVLEDRKLEP